MMSDTDVLKNINGDLADAPAARIIYLEGKTDPPMFFGLLGKTPAIIRPGFCKYQTTAVKGLESKGSGNSAVSRYVQVASANRLGGKVFGVVDGDGASLSTLASTFDQPHAGPLYTWKAYSIESFLPRTTWLAAWGAEPAWQTALQGYSPYVALNSLHRQLRGVLQTLGVAQYRNPDPGQPLLDPTAIEAALTADKTLITGFDVGVAFSASRTAFLSALANSLEEGLALLNGKWLLNHFLVHQFGQTAEYWMGQWIAQATTSGGLTEVKELWERITGSPP